MSLITSGRTATFAPSPECIGGAERLVRPIVHKPKKKPTAEDNQEIQRLLSKNSVLYPVFPLYQEATLAFSNNDLTSPAVASLRPKHIRKPRQLTNLLCPDHIGNVD